MTTIYPPICLNGYRAQCLTPWYNDFISHANGWDKIFDNYYMKRADKYWEVSKFLENIR